MTFVAGGVNVATLTSTTFTVNQVDVDNLRFSGNAISATNSDGDIVFLPNGIGAVVMDNLRFSGNTITNSQPNAVTEINVTGDGYIRIPGTNGMVLPSGGSATRPSSVEVGLMRYNTDLQYVEIWDGLAWVSTAGAAAGITAATAQDIAVAGALMLG
jgi:transglutaminase-like putative cysteine protease